ncbi:MAG TPA: hypothetical protein VJ396_01095 [Acidiferrobacterales bacterium]|nr:hypothetical protein [Acidiferrobacterales bacterium]
MSDFSLLSGFHKASQAGIVSASSRGTVVSHGANHTKGAYTQLIASTPHDADAVLVTARHTTNWNALTDLAIGAAASEQVIAANLMRTTWNGLITVCQYLLPIAIPAGTRMAARGQTDDSGARDVWLHATLLTGGFRRASPLSQILTLGADTTNTRGTPVTSGAANTKGSWVQLSSSLPNTLRGLLVAFGANAGGIGATEDWLLDIGVGAAASEQVVAPDLSVTITDSELCFPQVQPAPLEFAAGQRLAIRGQSSVASAVLDVVVYGVT